ncbi:MAG: S8 family serine peptidase [Leptolyngbyaceae cyanobacterium bins.302]|nr:S8 family serine peptidase [Leptolyngbyaceae cyanobacterium bins.302]
MPGDAAGNTLAAARSIDASLGFQSFGDRVESLDPNDYYRFSLNRSASLSLSLQNLSADANLQLLNSQGVVVQSSTNTGASAEALNTALNPGTYYIRVLPARLDAATDYTLNFNAQSNPNIDIVWRDYASGANAVWLMGGSSNTISTGSVSIRSVEPNWQMEAIADFNQDGSNDILWREYGNGITSIWFMGGVSGTTIASTTLLSITPTHWQIEGVADFNQDGITDIIWRDYASGMNGVWLMGGANNTTVASVGVLDTIGTTWRIEGVADFNRDGRPDLLWRDAVSGLNSIWFMGGANSTQIASFTLIDSRSTHWAIEGVVDFNQDGAPDILWRDYATGNNEVWLMGGENNATLITTAPINSVPPSWQAIPVNRSGQPPSADLAGNTPASAFDIGALGIAAYRDSVGLSDPNDYYRFTVIDRSNFNLSLRGLTADADVQLLNADGTLIQSSANPGILAESINRTLDAGTYLIRIFPYNQPTPYTLNLSATPIATPTPTVNLTTTDANAAEVLSTQVQNSGQFTLSRTGNTSTALTLNYTLSGTATNGIDFSQINSIVIPIGRSSITIPITVIDDSLIEGNETVTLTLNPGSGYTLGTSTTATVTIADNDQISFANFTVVDASGDGTANTVFQGGALHLSYAVPTGTSVSQVRLEALRNNSVVSTLGTWTTSNLTRTIVNLDGITTLTGGDYQLRAVARTTTNQEIFSAFQPFKVLSWSQPSGTIFGSYTADTLTASSATNQGQIFVGRGGTDTLDLTGVTRANVTSINGLLPSNYNALSSTAQQAIFRGTAFDYLTLADGREIYFQGIESLKFSDGSLSLPVKPNDPNFGKQWNLHITDVSSAWRFTQGANNVLLVSWDGGIGGSVGAITDITQSRLIRDSRSDSNEPEFDAFGNPDGGHGHTAISVMAAIANNTSGITGINWNSPVLVHDNYGDFENPDGTFITLVDSIREAAALARQNGWKIVVQGGVQGYYWLDGVRSQLEQLIQQNSDIALFAVAAGNGSLDIDDEFDGDSYTYGGGVASLQTDFSNVMAVGALRPGTPSNRWYQTGAGITTVDNLTNATSVSLASYSNRGASLTLVAPTDAPAMTRFDTLEYFSGTSAANPNLAAIASLVWSVNTRLNATQVRQLLIDTAMDLGVSGKDTTFGHGLVNADAAVRRATALSRNQTLASLYSGRSEFA